MAAVQQTDRVSFGTGRIYNYPAGGGAPIKAGFLNDATVKLTVDQKEIYGEGSFAASVADGHRMIEISTKQYELNLNDIANDFSLQGSAALGPSVTTVAFDEAGTVPGTTPYTHSLTNAATYVAGTLDLVVYVQPTGVAKPYPVQYQIVTAGSEVAGVSASVSNVGVVTFAAGDAGATFAATYQYGATTGKSVLITAGYQNSSPSYSMKLWKRDRSPIDNSTGILQLELFSVRPGGLTMPFSEGNYANYEKTYRAFADSLGNVFRMTFVNV